MKNINLNSLFKIFIVLLFLPMAAIASNDQIIWGKDATIGITEKFDRVIVLAGQVHFYGQANEMVVLGGNVTLHRGSRLEKSLVVVAGNIEKQDGAYLGGDQILVQAPQDIPRYLLALAPVIPVFYSGISWFWTTLIWLFINWIGGVSTYYFFPVFMASVESRARERKIHSFLWSFLGVLFFVPILLLLVISLIGIFFIPIYIMLYGMIWGMGYVVAASLIGQKLPFLKGKQGYSHFKLFLGLVCFSALSLLLPAIGKLIILIISLISAGAIFSTLKSKISKA